MVGNTNVEMATDSMSEIVTREPDCVEGHLPEVVGWQEAMRRAYRDRAILLKDLGLAEAGLLGGDSSLPNGDFPLFVPREWAARIRPGDLADPLLRQVLISPEEYLSESGFTDDPVGDLKSQTTAGLLHKYSGRALLVTTGACGVHCRYCFRRHFPYHEAPKSISGWQAAFQALEQDGSIEEILLSGGDPLTLVDRTLQSLVERLADIPHLKRLRIHTRMPVAIPQRVTHELCQILQQTRLGLWIVVHINHAQEIDQATEQAIRKLRQTGAVLLNQAVLLRGVNDNITSLEQLSKRLVDLQIIPYYLHQLDRVAGAAHFEVSVAEGLNLIQELRRRMPGYAVPRYVQEIAGEPSKTPLDQSVVQQLSLS